MTIAGDTLEGLSVITLGSAEDGVGVEASFVPGAGMIGCSLRHRGEELLGQRGGLRRYIDKHSTMGIPLLYPWANRLSSWRFPVAGREVVLDAGPPAPSLDGNGLPIHGLLAADGGWQLDELRTGEAGGSVLGASLDFAARPDLMAAFPFPHLLRIEAAVTGSRLTITTSVIATGDQPVPIAFGFHPVPVPAGGRSPRLGDRGAGARAARARRSHAAHGPAGGGARGHRAAWVAHLRRRLRGP